MKVQVSGAICRAFLILLLIQTGWADYPITHPNCGPVTSADFRTTFLVTHPDRNENATKHESMHDLIRFDLLKNGDDFDVYYGGFEGILYRYNAQNQQVTQIHDFQTIQGSYLDEYNNGDHGLTGIVFHPDFETNRWLFVFYAPRITNNNQNRVMRLSRWEMNEQFQLQNEKVLLRMEATNIDKWHSGGDMYFNAQGDLFIQVGDNIEEDRNSSDKIFNAGWTSANTSNLLGGVVRIHPDNSDLGYSIPKDNFGEYFAQEEGDDVYMDTSRVKPEIFAKGQRSNFSATGHPTELIHIWGEVCTNSQHDEVNVVNRPVFSGWPFFQGNASSNITGGSNGRYSFGLNDTPTLSQTANSNIMGNGLSTLPNVYPADMVMGFEFNIVMAQAFYYYGKGESIWPGRTFPPQFHETFMFSGYGGGNARMVPIIRNGSDVTAEMKNNTYQVNGLISNSGAVFNGMTEAKYGPDGALYILARGGQYGSPKSLITRIDYTGSCQDEALFTTNRAAFEAAELEASSEDHYRPGFFDPALVGLAPGFNLARLQEGDLLRLEVYDLQGKRLTAGQARVSVQGALPLWEAKAPARLPEGIYLLRYSTLQGEFIRSSKHLIP